MKKGLTKPPALPAAAVPKREEISEEAKDNSGCASDEEVFPLARYSLLVLQRLQWEPQGALKNQYIGK